MRAPELHSNVSLTQAAGNAGKLLHKSNCLPPNDHQPAKFLGNATNTTSL
jgi:hypothetical protein